VIGGITNSGDGISLTWTACTTTPAYFVAAWSWIAPASAGQVQIDYRPGEPKFLGITDCSFQEIDASYIYFAGVDVADPWEGEPNPDAVEPTTWGEIKSMFR
jgi:hypothetical protein